MNQALIYVFASALTITVLSQIGIVQRFTHYFILIASANRQKKYRGDQKINFSTNFFSSLPKRQYTLKVFSLLKSTNTFPESTNKEEKTDISLTKKNIDNTHTSSRFINSLILLSGVEQS